LKDIWRDTDGKNTGSEKIGWEKTFGSAGKNLDTRSPACRQQHIVLKIGLD